MRIRTCKSRQSAGAGVLVRAMFRKYPDQVKSESGPLLSDVVAECKRHNPSLEAASIYAAIEACGPSDQEVQEWDNAKH